MPHGYTKEEWDQLRERWMRVGQRAGDQRLSMDMTAEYAALQCGSPAVLAFIEALLDKLEER